MWDDNIQTEFDHETGGRLSVKKTDDDEDDGDPNPTLSEDCVTSSSKSATR